MSGGLFICIGFKFKKCLQQCIDVLYFITSIAKHVPIVDLKSVTSEKIPFSRSSKT